MKGAMGIDTSTLTWKADLASLDSKVDTLDLCKFKTVSADLSKLSNEVGEDVVRLSKW